MAIQYVGGQSAAVTSASNTTVPFSLTGGIASTPADGDLVIVSYSAVSTVDEVVSGRVVTSGYTLITELFASDTQSENFAVFRKFMTSTPDTNIVIGPVSNVIFAASVTIQVFRGVNTTTPLDVTTTTSAVSSTAVIDPPAITPVTSGAIIVVTGGSGNLRGPTASYTAAYLTNFITTTADANNDTTTGAGYVSWTSGAYNPAAWTFNATDSVGYSYACATLALRPAPSSPITGTASGTLTHSGASAGSTKVSAQASGLVDITGTSSASAVASASASGGITDTGTSSGTVGVSGSAASTYTISGASTGGMAALTGQASGALDVSGAATGILIFSGGASGVLTIGGASAGGVIIAASAASTYTVTGKSKQAIQKMRYGEAIVRAAYLGDTPVNVIAVGDHVVLEW